MKADIRAPRRKKGEPMKGTTTNVGKLTLTATHEDDERLLAAIAYSLFPIGKKRNAKFDAFAREVFGE